MGLGEVPQTARSPPCVAGAAEGEGGQREKKPEQAAEFQCLSQSVLSAEGPGADASVLARSSGTGLVGSGLQGPRVLAGGRMGIGEGTDCGESKEIKSAGLGERLVIGVRERELGERWTTPGRLGRARMSSVALACGRRGHRMRRGRGEVW